MPTITAERLKELENKEARLATIFLVQAAEFERRKRYVQGVADSYKQRPDS